MFAGKNLDITKPCYCEHILPVPWSFIMLRFHYITDKLTLFYGWFLKQVKRGEHCVPERAKRGLPGWEV